MSGKDQVSYKLLCNACLCVGQALNLITDARLKHFYLEALNEIPQINITNIMPVLCLDCEALLKRAISFKMQVKDSYQVLLKYSEEYLQDSFLTLVSRTPRLQLKTNNAINISPETNDAINISPKDSVLEIEPFVKNELKMDWEGDRDTIEASEQPDTQQIYLKDDLKIESDLNFGENSNDDLNDIDYEQELVLDNSKKKKKTKKGTKEKRSKKEKKNKLREKKEIKDPSSKIKCIELSYDEMVQERDKDMSKDTYTKSEYKCDTCIMGFKYHKSYKTHLTRRHDPSIGDYKCPVCRTIFATVDSFTSHYKRHMRRYECSICSKRTMDSKVMQQHYYSTHEITLKQYKCIDCGVISNSIDTHRYHRQSHKGRLECPECDKTFRHRAGLLNHRLAVHEYKNKFPCNVCDKVFKWRTSLRRHQDTHENKKPVPAAAYCALCGINFSSMCSYQRHMNNSLKHITKDQLRFVCDHCNKKFADKTKLRNHIEEKHLHKTFQCNICMKTSKNRVGLEQHIRNVHKGRPNNKMCHHCGKGFPTKVQLESHIRTHTGERPFICEYCPTTFSQQSNLYKHNRQVHLNMKSKRYVPCKKIDEPLVITLTAPSVPLYTETGYLNAEL